MTGTADGAVTALAVPHKEPSRPRRWATALAAPLAAALLSVVTACIAGWVRGTYPFGTKTRNTNDLGEQYVPMLTYARDVITGNAHGDLLFSWQSGHGVPVLGDSLAYVGTTLSWLVLLFPRDRIDLSLFAIYVAALGLGAAFMTLLLRRLRPSAPAALAVVGGVAYGTAAWPVETAYMTIWLNGMVAFPALCLLADWVMECGTWRQWVAGPPLVALAWTSHFYTVYMATIGAAAFVVLRVLTVSETPWRQRLAGLVRTGAVFVLGIALAAPLLVPVYRLVQNATPSPEVDFVAAPWDIFLARLLPATGGVADTPAIAVGSLMLVMALTTIANSRLRIVERVVLPLGLVLILGSMQLPSTHLVWHAFDSPNGNPYRQSFIACGFIVIVGWMSLSVGVSRRVVLACCAVVAALLWWVHDLRDTTPLTTPVAAAGLLLLALLWARQSTNATSPPPAGRSRRLSRLAPASFGIGLLLVMTVAESTLSQVAIDSRRSEVLSAKPMTLELRAAVRELVQTHDQWPQFRTSPGSTMSVNDPMLVGGEGSEFYTSTIHIAITELHVGLGWGYSSYGRALVDPATPVTDALFAVRNHVVATDTAGQPTPLSMRTQDAAPLVTVRPPTPRPSTLPSVWGAHERALGAALYDLPVPTFTAEGATVAQNPRGYTARSTSTAPGRFTMSVQCQPGSDAYLYSPALVGTFTVDGARRLALKAIAKRPGVYTALPLAFLGSVGTDGRFDVDVTMTTPQTRLTQAPVGCLRPGALESAITSLQSTAATDVTTTGHSIGFAVAPSTSARSAVLSVPLVPGWSCSGPVSDATPNSFQGLLSVGLSSRGGTVECSYRPPGMRLGAAIAAGALGLWLILGVGALLLGRRRDRSASTVTLAR
ncbi:MAG: YfhO family protein [Knoellia sp.]